MQISQMYTHHHLHRFPAQSCHHLPHPHQTVKVHHCFLLLYCFQCISEEDEYLGSQPCTCIGSLYANNLGKSCRMSSACSLHPCYDSCKQLIDVVDVCFPIMVFLHAFNPYIIILDQTKSNGIILE